MTRRNQMIKEGQLADVLIVDFLTQHEDKLHELHKQYMSDTGDNIEYMMFCISIYHDYQDLVLNPENN